MPRTRTGKIARLPYAVREEVNVRIREGRQLKDIAAWLNEQPAVKAIVDQSFRGIPVSIKNLSAWYTGGFLDKHQRRRKATRPPSQAALERQRRAAIRDFIQELEESKAHLTLERALLCASVEWPLFVPGADWKRRRCAVLALVCRDYGALRGKFVYDRQLIRLLVAKYEGLPLGKSGLDPRFFQIGTSSLPKYFAQWSSSPRPYPSIFLPPGSSSPPSEPACG